MFHQAAPHAIRMNKKTVFHLNVRTIHANQYVVSTCQNGAMSTPIHAKDQIHQQTAVVATHQDPQRIASTTHVNLTRLNVSHHGAHYTLIHAQDKRMCLKLAHSAKEIAHTVIALTTHA
jgi:hypothetical protein